MRTVALLTAACLLLSACDRGFSPETPTRVVESYATWGGEGAVVRVEENIIVAPGSTLEILPGTIVEIVEGAAVETTLTGEVPRTPRLLIEGQLLAVGTAEAPIRFRLVEGDEPANDFYDITIRPASPDGAPSRLAWADVAQVQWIGGPVVVEDSRVDGLVVQDAVSVHIARNHIGTFTLDGGTGTFSDNVVVGAAWVYNTDLWVRGNTFAQATRGLVCALGCTVQIDRNTFDRCDTAVELFEGLPVLTANNFVGNTRHLLVRPNAARPDTGTVQASGNWWGTTDLDAIRQRILYLPNGDRISSKVIVLEPTATGPF